MKKEAKTPSPFRMKRAWLCGWSVDCDAFARLCSRLRPEEEAAVFPPTQEGVLALERQACEAYGGYSLGAHLLMRRAGDPASPLARAHDVCALAPFLAFPAEYRRGGRIRKAQLEIVRRRVEKDPAAAVRDFHALAGLSDLQGRPGPNERQELLEGLAILASPGVDEIPPICAFWHFVLGGRDPLLDAAAIAERLPPGASRIASEAGHDAGPLFSTLRQTHAL